MQPALMSDFARGRQGDWSELSELSDGSDLSEGAR